MTASCLLSDLGPLGDHLGDGKQGNIYTLKRNLSLVFKRYKDAGHVNKYLLSELIDWADKLHPIERSLILTSTAWPRTLVRERETVIGITMLRAPERFTHLQPDGERALTNISTAISLDRPHVRVHIPVPNDRERLLLAYRLCRLLALFERDGLLFTDLSPKNLLWTLTPKPEVFLLDCDSALFKDRLSPGPPFRTSNWFDPWFRNKPTSEEVRGLFTLIFARLVFARKYPNIKSHLVLPPEHPFSKHFQDIVTEGYSPSLSGRPSMLRWQERIEELLSQIKPRQEPAAASSSLILSTPIKLTAADNPKEPEEGRLIYRSNFYQPDDQWIDDSETSTRRLFRQDGYFHVELKAPIINIICMGIPVTDFRVHVDAEPLKGVKKMAYGICFRYVEDNDKSPFYFISIYLDSYALLLCRNDEYEFLLDNRSCEFIKLDGINSLMVQMVGQRITLGINGHILDTVMDNTLTSGRVGIIVSKIEDPPAEIRFRDFRLYSLE